jgi:hypothetical protein
MVCPCCKCQSFLDCGCVDPTHTLYPAGGLEGCCPPDYYWEAGHGCWQGVAGTEIASGEREVCCDGVCKQLEFWYCGFDGDCTLDAQSAPQGPAYCSKEFCEQTCEPFIFP